MATYRYPKTGAPRVVIEHLPIDHEVNGEGTDLVSIYFDNPEFIINIYSNHRRFRDLRNK